MKIVLENVYVKNVTHKEKTDRFPEKTVLYIQDKNQNYAVALLGNIDAKSGVMLEKMSVDVKPYNTKYGLMFQQI